jgi:hypothetical protein
MKCKDYSVRQILIGLHRVGIVGLYDAIQLAQDSGLEQRDAIVDLIIDALRAKNYIPDGQVGDYRPALWREYLRHRGEDFTELYSEVPVTVRGEPGDDRERFVELTRAAMARFELRPAIDFAPAAADGPNPQLVIGGEVVAVEPQTPRGLEDAVRKSLSDW